MKINSIISNINISKIGFKAKEPEVNYEMPNDCFVKNQTEDIEVTDQEDTDVSFDDVLPMDKKWAKYYREKYGFNGFGLKFPKNTRKLVYDIDRIEKSRDIYILPSADGQPPVVFKSADQKWLKSLKDGESVIVGRWPSPGEIEDDIATRRVFIPYELNNNYISRNHLLFENIDGNIYVTDISRNGTSLANSHWAVSYEDLNK